MTGMKRWLVAMAIIRERKATERRGQDCQAKKKVGPERADLIEF